MEAMLHGREQGPNTVRIPVPGFVHIDHGVPSTPRIRHVDQAGLERVPHA